MTDTDQLPTERETAGSTAAHCSANLRELANTFRRMGDDANHVRRLHMKPRRGSTKSDTKIRVESAAAATAYYNCMRYVQRLLPNDKLTDSRPR